ncbi:MAG: hypothetical protein K5686_10585 [Lachnospiraceae bacterium]|nr:hypothetical protein [Lachnospiraceae bacterium]
MGNWERMTDFEAEKMEEFKGRFTINFRKIYFDIDEISERTMEINEKHPKDTLMLSWAGCMTGLFIVFLFVYQAFALITIPFIAFYLMALIKMGKCWKSFNYKLSSFFLMSLGGIILAFAAAYGVRYLFLTFIL